MVVTDHSPCTPELKRLDLGDFEGAWGGIASLQLGLSIVWTQARARGFTLTELSRWMSDAPARLAGIASRKGRIAPGLDADLVVFQPEASFVVEGAKLHHRHKVTPYEGQRLMGVVKATYRRGEAVMQGGQFIGRPSGVSLLRGAL